MTIGSKLQTWMLTALGTLLVTALPAQASIIVSVQSVTAGVGSTGNPLEVTVLNTGTAVTVASFNFTIQTGDTDITFTGTDANTTSAPYIFMGDSFDQAFSFPLNTMSPGQTMDGNDLSLSGSGTLVPTSTMFALGRVLFDVAANAATGTFPVTLLQDTAHTSLTDPNGRLIPIDTFIDGQITIAAAGVPEPATGLLAGLALAGTVLMKRRKR